jgi:hypothetical protein
MIGARGIGGLVRAVALAVAAGLLATMTAGCAAGGAASSTAGGPAGPTTAPLTAWQQTLNQVRPDGTVSTSTALAAFALAIGPVPGARLASGPKQVIPSGTLAVQWVLGHWSALTAGQRHAVLADLGVPGATTSLDSVTVTPASPNIPCLTADAGPAGPFRSQLAGIESDIAAHLGDGPFTPDVYIAVNTKNLEAPSKLYTYGCTGSTPVSGSGSVSGCTIHVNPVVSGGGFPAAEVHDFLIHELTHCYLFLRLGGAYATMPSWYVEGAASWAMGELGNGSALASGYWQTYLTTPDAPLFVRAYSALGYFVHLAETGTNVWHRLIPMGKAILSGGNAAGWAAADPTTRFFDSWGSGYAEGRYPGAAWTTGGPGLPTYQGPIPQESVANGQTVTVGAPAAAVGISNVSLSAEVVLFAGSSGASGRISLDGGDDATLEEADTTAYTTGSQQNCPAGTPNAGARLTPVTAGRHYVSVTGGLAAASVHVTGMSLASFCAQANTASCVVGNWTTTHLEDTLPGAFTEAGGAGVTMRIGADGATVIDFGQMSPMKIIAKKYTADYSFGGVVAGRLVLPKSVPAGSAFELSPAPGTALDLNGMTVTVQVTSPISYAMGPMSMGAMAKDMGSQSSSMPAAPGTEGSWTCSGSTLINRGPASLPSYGSWTWTRTS